MKKNKITKIHCLFCNLEMSSDKLGQHLYYKHSWNFKNNTKKYYDRYIKKENEGFCLECSKNTKYRSFNKGYDTYCCLKCCNKNNFERMRNRNEEIYGDRNYSNREQFKRTTKKNNTWERSVIKGRQTKLEKYGDENYNNREQYKQTCLDRFGFPCNLMIPEVRDKVGTSVSLISQELFNSLYYKLSSSLKKYTKYYSLNNEFYIYYTDINFYSCDFCIENIKVIIEFYGDLWHANPIKFNENDFPLKGFNISIQALDIWKKDKKRLDFLRNIGYEVLVIWEKDYRKNKEKTIIDCLDFIKINQYKTGFLVDRLNTIESKYHSQAKEGKLQIEELTK